MKRKLSIIVLTLAAVGVILAVGKRFWKEQIIFINEVRSWDCSAARDGYYGSDYMNFFDNIPNFNPQITPINNPIMNNNINYKIQELEQKIKKLELRIIQLENNNQNHTYTEPDNSLYMI